MSLVNDLAKKLSLNYDWLVLITMCLIGYVISTTIYNLFFHPLSKCPGPFLARVSMLPSFYHAYKGDRHVWLWKCFHIYGGKIRVEPNTVVFLDPKAHRDIYGPKANVKRCKTYEAWVRNEDELNTITTTDPASHAQKRRLLNQAFTDKSVKHAAVFMAQHTERWLDILLENKEPEAQWTKPRNMSTWTDYLVFDILGDLAFGRSFEIKEPVPNPIRDIPHHIVNYVRFFYPITRSPMMEFVSWAKPRGLNRFFDLITPKEIKLYYQFIDESVSRRIQEEKLSKDDGTARMDMFHFLCNAKHPDTGELAYTEKALRAEALLLIVAGSDSLSTALSGFWFYISRNNSAYSKLIEEIRSTFTSSEEIVNGSKLASCTYLHACINETLRLTPPGPSELGREVLPGGTIINEEHFPQGVVVGCSGFSMGRNNDIFGDAEKFRPERYIISDSVTAEDVNRIRSCYHPFLIGPTNCAGKSIAMLEFSLIAARTLFRLDLRAAPGESLGAGHPSLGWGRGDVNQYQLIDAYIAVRDGPILQFKNRYAK